MTRAVLVCPGRGSYTEKSLGSLPEGHPWVARAEELRAGYGLGSLVELDRARKFEPRRHLEPATVSPLIWLVSMLDAAAAAEEHDLVAVAGNSMGWYTALAVAGALDFDDGFRLMQELALLQQRHAAGGEGGGQVLYPRVDERWREDPAKVAAIEAALAARPGEVFRSIELGGYVVLAGTEAGVAHLLKALPKTQQGSTLYPFRLMQHGPYHTPLLEGVAASARETLGRLGWRTPRVALVDGRGVRWSPWSTDVAALAGYTLGLQITATYDLSASLRVLLREHAPDRIVLPGPGNTLGGVCGQALVAEGWRGIRSRADFDRAQAGDEPIVVSMRR